jgi:hypothetical protein
VRDAYLEPQTSFAARLDRVRLAARLARSNLEASVARFRGEPGISPARVIMLDGILANAHRFVHAVMSLEAGLSRSRPVPAREAFRAFADAVVRGLSLLMDRLHGAPASEFPSLREAHSELLRSGDPQVDRHALVNLEADRIVNSLNTLAMEVNQWTGTG